MADEVSTTSWKMERMIGFNGKFQGSVLLHPNGKQILYVVDNIIILENLEDSGYGSQRFFKYHAQPIKHMVLSQSGKVFVTAETTAPPARTKLAVWYMEKNEPVGIATCRDKAVQTLGITCDDLHLVTMGGVPVEDLVVWKLPNGPMLYRVKLPAPYSTLCLKPSKRRSNIFASGGKDYLRVWMLEADQPTISSAEIELGRGSRDITAIEMADDKINSYFLAGTSKGEILVVNMADRSITAMVQYRPQPMGEILTFCILKAKMETQEYDPSPDAMLPGFQMIIGSGDGFVGMFGITMIYHPSPRTTRACFHRMSNTNLWKDKVTPDVSITTVVAIDKEHFLVGRSNGSLYKFTLADCKHRQTLIDATGPVYDIRFPKGSSQFFVTSHSQEVLVRNMPNGDVKHRFEMPHSICSCVAMSEDGSTLITGWSDGMMRILAFDRSPKCHNYHCSVTLVASVHAGGMSAVCLTEDAFHFISGGKDGLLKEWHATERLKPQGERKYRVSCIETINDPDSAVVSLRSICRPGFKQCAALTEEGSVVVWNLLSREHFMVQDVDMSVTCVAFLNMVLMTGEAGGKVTCWHPELGWKVQELPTNGNSITALDAAQEGRVIATVDSLNTFKVWDYYEGKPTFLGKTQSSSVEAVCVCPGSSQILTVGDTGSILVWRLDPSSAPVPPEVPGTSDKKEEDPQPSTSAGSVISL